MKAAIFRAGDIVVGDIPEPTPSAGQVLVKTLACGICGSDLHIWRGHGPGFPRKMSIQTLAEDHGREAVGECKTLKGVASFEVPRA